VRSRVSLLPTKCSTNPALPTTLGDISERGLLMSLFLSLSSPWFTVVVEASVRTNSKGNSSVNAQQSPRGHSPILV